jgi:RNA polymerase-binding transcription factor DksA
MNSSLRNTATSPNVEDVPPKWKWHHETLLQLGRKLLQAQAEHQRAASATTELRGLDSGDVAQEETEHEVILAELHAEKDRLAEIDAALERIRTGRYGVCEELGTPISPARLRAIPWTRFSRAAAERHERRP